MSFEELNPPAREDVDIDHVDDWFVAMKYMRTGMTGLLANPYMDEWDAALKAEFNNSVPVGAGTFVQSEVMDFI